MPADLPPTDVPALTDTAAGAEVSASVPLAYGLKVDADVCADLDLDLADEAALALRSDADLGAD